MEIKITGKCKQNGYQVKENGIIILKLKLAYNQLTNSITLMQLLNNDISLNAKNIELKKNLGIYRIKNIIVDGDGESAVTLTTTQDFANINTIAEFIKTCEVDTEFDFMIKGKIEEENLNE